MTRLRGILLIALLGAGPSAQAQPHEEPMQHPPMMSGAAGGDYRGMMEQMRAHQQKLDELVAAMEAAQGPEKVDAIAAVVKELVSQRRATIERMQAMHGSMMR